MPSTEVSAHSHERTVVKNSLGRGVQEGSHLSWRVLYEELGERVFRLVLRMTGDPDLASDLTHDTFVRVHERGDRYSGNGTLAGWVLRIAKNLARDRLRRDRFQVEWTAVETSIGDPEPRTGTSHPETRLLLEAALARLPEAQRTVLLLYEVDGYTHPEIAEMLEIPVGTSKARLSRAKARLRAFLESQERGGE